MRIDKEKQTMHPNGRVFHTPYHAMPNKKSSKRLAKRVKDYEAMITGSGSYTGYIRPGSMQG